MFHARLDRDEVGQHGVDVFFAPMDRNGPALLTETYQTARLRFPGYDIYYVESEWRSWVKTKEAPRDPDRAYLAFFATFAKSNPI